MTYKNLKEEAIENLRKKRVQRRSVYTVGAIFTAISALLFVISLKVDGNAVFWIRFPILIFALIYGVIYFASFGFPFMEAEMTEEDIEKEMVKIYAAKDMEDEEDIDELELKEIETLKNRWDDEEYV